MILELLSLRIKMLRYRKPQRRFPSCLTARAAPRRRRAGRSYQVQLSSILDVLNRPRKHQSPAANVAKIMTRDYPDPCTQPNEKLKHGNNYF